MNCKLICALVNINLIGFSAKSIKGGRHWSQAGKYRRGLQDQPVAFYESLLASNERLSDFYERFNDLYERLSDFYERFNDLYERLSDFYEWLGDFYERLFDLYERFGDFYE